MRQRARSGIFALSLGAVYAAGVWLVAGPQDAATGLKGGIEVSAPASANYVWHLLAVARVGYDSLYAVKFGEAVISDDRRFLESNRKLLTFGRDHPGPLGWLATALPVRHGIDTESDFQRYFSLLADGFENADFVPFLDRWPLDWVDPVVAANRAVFDVQQEQIQAMKPFVTALRRLGVVYSRNLPRWRQTVWPAVEPAVKARAAEVEADVRTRDLVAAWTRATGLSASTPLGVLLCYAAENGPDPVAVGSGREVFYFDRPRAPMLETVGHRFGLHVLAPLERDLRDTGDFSAAEVHAAVETLAMFYNRQVLAVDTLHYALPQYRDAERLRIYAQKWKPGVTPEQLLLAVLKPTTP
jgi:hypothetical protein